VPVIIVSPPVTVINNHRSIPPTEWAPAIVIIIPEPGYPGRGPVITRYPIPMIKGVPLPSAIVVGKISPRVKRTPGIPIKGIPNPTSIVIGSPVIPHVVRYPDIGVIGVIVSPSTIPGQFMFIFFIAAVQVLGGAIAGITQFTGSILVPAVEIIFVRGIEIVGTFFDLAVKHDNFLVFPDIPVEIVTGNFSDSIVDVDLGLSSFTYINPVSSLVQQKYAAIRGLYFYISFIVEVFNIKVNASPDYFKTHVCFS
jgi:hypothetical protein